MHNQRQAGGHQRRSRVGSRRGGTAGVPQAVTAAKHSRHRPTALSLTAGGKYLRIVGVLAMARRCLVPVLALLLALSVDARGLRQAAVLAGEPALPGLPKVLQEVSRRAAEALAASEAAAQQQAAVAAGAADPAAQPSSSTPAHNEAANALSPAQREFVEGLTDYLFFELGYSPDEQRLAWSSWTQDDKDLYNDYNGFWLTQTPEEKARFIKLVPYVGFSYAEFLRGLELYLTSRESGDAPEALGLNSELRYAYFKYDLYWGVLSEVEREELRELAGRGSGGEQVSAPDGSLPTDQEEFRRGLAGYLNFLLQPADRQNEIWEGYSLAAKELFYNYQSYWTSLSPASQQAAVQVITGQAPLDSLPARTAQQEFLIGLQQYLIFIGRPADVQVAQLAGFSAEVVAAFTGYRNYWAGLSESERREHLALIRAVVAAEASASASLPATVVDPTVSQEFLLQLHNYLQFQALGSSEQEARWATYSQQEREQFARIQDYWLGTSAEGQALALERVRILLRTIPFPNVVGLSWEQVQFLIRLKEYLDVRSLPPQERVLVTQSWSMAQWEKYNEDDAFWLSLSFDDQQTLVDRLNRAMSGAVVDTPPSAVGYEGTLSIKERQFLKGLRLFLDFSARPIAEQQMQLSGLTAAQLAAYNGYTEYWSALPAEEKEAVLARMEEPGVLSVVSDLSVLAEEVPGSGQADIYQGILSIRERQFLKGLQLYLEFIQLPVSEQEQQLVTLTSTQFRVYENYRSYWQGLSAQAKAEKLLQLSEPGILDVSADLSQTFIIPSGPSTGPVSGEYTGSLSLPERQFLKAVQFYLEFIQRPLPEQQAQTAGLAGIQRQVFENIRNFWQTQTPLQQAQIRAQMSEPGILDVPTVLSPEIMNAIPNRAMEADSPAQQATSRAASVPVASYNGDLSTRERQFLKGLQSYLDFAAQPDMVRSVELQNLSEQQRQVYIGFQSYWSALPEPEKRQLLARMQEPGILNVESDLSLEVGLPGKAVEAMESRAGGTLQAEMRAPSVPTAGASQTGKLSLRERQFLKVACLPAWPPSDYLLACMIHACTEDAPLSDRCRSSVGL